MDIIKGTDLMLFVKNSQGVVKSLAFATNHTLSISGETTEVSTKDHGIYGATEVTKITWSINTDNLYTVATFNELYDRMISRQTVEVYFCLKTESEREGTPATVNLEGDTYDSWTPTTDPTEEGYYGRAYVTSLDCTAQSGENATFSATLSGVGALYKGVYGSVESTAGGSTTITIGSGASAQSYDQATGNYDNTKTYYIYSNGEMIPVDMTGKVNGTALDSKQVYYVETEDAENS